MDDPRAAADRPERPRLRRLEVRRHVAEGQPGVVVSDPLEVAAGQCFIPDGALAIVGRFDGEHTIAEIEADLRRRGLDLPQGLVSDLARQLDDALLLDSPRGRAAEAAAYDEFSTGVDGARPARHAGSAGYPRQPAQLRARLAAMLPDRTPPHLPAPRGLIAPHIDLARGAAGYRAAYGHLQRCTPADLYVVFGTGHKGPGAPVTGLTLDWQTPIGRVRTDRAFVDAVQRRLGPPDPRDALLHRDEHSIEFQVLMLAHLLAGHEFAVAGFLCGELPSAGGDPGAEAYVADLLDAFRAAARERGQRVCYVAGADLAHLGPFFGDETPLDAATLARLERDDRARLAHLSSGAAGAFHRSVVASGNRDRVCGTTPMYLCAALAGGGAELLHYGQATADDGSQVVTFCSMVVAG